MISFPFSRSFPLLLLVLSLFSWCVLCQSAPYSPTPVFLDIAIQSISKINGVEQSWSNDFYLTALWQDPRFSPKFNESTGELVGSFELGKDWEPRIEFVNKDPAVDPVIGTQPPDCFSIESYDSVKTSNQYSSMIGYYESIGLIIPNVPFGRLDQRYGVSLLTPLDLRKFPFDTQEALIHIESQLYDRQTVMFQLANRDRVANIVPEGLDVVGWSVRGVNVRISNFTYQVFNQDYSRLSVIVRMKRLPEFYLLKIVAGSMLLVYMCIWVFALAVDSSDRMMGTLSVFAGLITFLFVAAQDVPKVPYQTRLDVFMTFSFFITFAIMFVHGALYFFREEEDDEADAQKKDHEMKEMGADEKKSNPHHHHHGGAVGFFQSWWNSLVPTRKWDVVFIPAFAISYSIGVAVILGRPH